MRPKDVAFAPPESTFFEVMFFDGIFVDFGLTFGILLAPFGLVLVPPWLKLPPFGLVLVPLWLKLGPFGSILG